MKYESSFLFELELKNRIELFKICCLGSFMIEMEEARYNSVYFWVLI